MYSVPLAVVIFGMAKIAKLSNGFVQFLNIMSSTSSRKKKKKKEKPIRTNTIRSKLWVLVTFSPGDLNNIRTVSNRFGKRKTFRFLTLSPSRSHLYSNWELRGTNCSSICKMCIRGGICEDFKLANWLNSLLYSENENELEQMYVQISVSLSLCPIL